MVKTLEDIVNEVFGNDNTLKPLFEAIAPAKNAYDEASKKDDKADTEAKKALYEKAQKDFDVKFQSFADRIRTVINAEREKDNLAIYSQEVAEKRKTRKISGIDADITKAQGSIDILSLQIDTIDKEIAEIRKGHTPATTN